MNSGIYKIINVLNNKMYIGSTKNFKKRFQTHLRMLRKNKHHSIKLQRAYNKYGEENFKFEIVEECEYTKNLIIERENYYIKKFNSKENGYNIADASFGDILTYHPNHDGIIQKRVNTQKANISKMTVEERKRKWGRYGVENGNFNPNKILNKCPICGKILQKGNKTCSKHRDRFGDSNPFYRKHHTEETKVKLSNARKGHKPSNSKRVFVENMIFESQAECARYFKISVGTVNFRIKSKHFSNWYNLS